MRPTHPSLSSRYQRVNDSMNILNILPPSHEFIPRTHRNVVAVETIMSKRDPLHNHRAKKWIELEVNIPSCKASAMHLNLLSSTRDTLEIYILQFKVLKGREDALGLSSSIHSKRVSIAHGFIQLSRLLPLVPELLHLRGWVLLFFLTSQYQKTLRTKATSRIRWFNKTVVFLCGNGCSQLYYTPESKFVLESISIWSFQNADSTPRSTAIASW